MIGGNSRNPALAMEWIQTRGLEPERIITSIIPLEQTSRGFQTLADHKEKDIKILVEPCDIASVLPPPELDNEWLP